MCKIVIVGCSGHAKSVVDMIESAGEYEIAGFVDRELNDTFEYRGYKIIGIDEDMKHIYDAGVHYAVIGIGYMGKGNVRNSQYETLKKIGFEFPVIIDRMAAVAKDVQIGEGTVIGKCAVVNSDANIGKMAIINSGAIVEHDCVVGDFSHIAVGATLCGNVCVGDNTLVGAGATIIQGLNVGGNAVVGAGSLVLRDVLDNEKVMGLVK